MTKYMQLIAKSRVSGFRDMDAKESPTSPCRPHMAAVLARCSIPVAIVRMIEEYAGIFDEKCLDMFGPLGDLPRHLQDASARLRAFQTELVNVPGLYDVGVSIKGVESNVVHIIQGSRQGYLTFGDICCCFGKVPTGSWKWAPQCNDNDVPLLIIELDKDVIWGSRKREL